VIKKILQEQNFIMVWMPLANTTAVPMNLTLLQVGKQVTKLYQAFFSQGKGAISLQVFI